MLGSESFAADRRLQIKPDARRRYASLERKLDAEAGPVGFTAHREPAEIILLAEQFIALELAGWKGRAGSALACDEGNLGFFRAMIAAAAGDKVSARRHLQAALSFNPVFCPLQAPRARARLASLDQPENASLK